MRRRHVLALLAMNAAGLALDRRTPAIAQPLPTIRVGATNGDGSKAVFYGRSSGIFQKAGLNVDITIINSGAAGMTSVHANSARDALARVETMVLMSGYDLPVRAIREHSRKAGIAMPMKEIDAVIARTRKARSRKTG